MPSDRLGSADSRRLTSCISPCNPCSCAVALLVIALAFGAVWLASDKTQGQTAAPANAPSQSATDSKQAQNATEPSGQLQWPSTPLSVTLLPKKDFVDENGMALAALLVAILSFIASVGVPAWLAKRARRSSVNDDFWVRQVAFPHVVIEGMAFMNEASQSLESMPTGHLQSFLPRWQEQKQRLQMLPAMLGSGASTQDAFQTMSNSLDAVQDAISDFSYLAGLPLSPSARSRAILDARKAIVLAQADWCDAMRKWQHKT